MSDTTVHFICRFFTSTWRLKYTFTFRIVRLLRRTEDLYIIKSKIEFNDNKMTPYGARKYLLGSVLLLLSGIILKLLSHFSKWKYNFQYSLWHKHQRQDHPRALQANFPLVDRRKARQKCHLRTFLPFHQVK